MIFTYNTWPHHRTQTIEFFIQLLKYFVESFNAKESEGQKQRKTQVLYIFDI